MLPDGLRALLLQTSAITAIIGTAATRATEQPGPPAPGSGVYWQQMPEGSLLPGLVLSQISGGGTPTLDGADPLHTARIQISAFGMTYGDAKSLSRAVRATLEGFAGTLPDGTLVGQTILSSEADAFDDGTFSFHCPTDFEFWYTES
jgi:hypothetical protein